MDSVIRYIVWPAVAGLVFGLVLLLLPAQLPRLAEWVPGLEIYLPPESPDPGMEIRLDRFSFAEAIEKASPAVVSINASADVLRETPNFNPFTGNIELEDETNLGSGVIISPDGYLITSLHIFQPQSENILDEFPEIIVTLYNGETLEARPLFFDPRNDLALLKVDAEEMAYLTQVEEWTLDVGDIVFAIGNPRNIGQSVTQGIISALLKNEESYLIQTDAAINPGNSGGALIDVDGRLVGINSTIVSESGGSEGISFAVPASKAFDLMDAYIEQGPSGYLGVEGKYINRFAASMIFDHEIQGFRVENLTRNGPAYEAGVRADDILTSIAGIPIISRDAEFFAIQTVTNMSPGDTVIVDIYRNGENLTLPITLGVGEAAMILDIKEENPSLLDPNPFRDGLIR